MDALDDPDESILRPPWGQLGRAATLAAVSAVCKLYLNLLVRNQDPSPYSADLRACSFSRTKVHMHASMHTTLTQASNWRAPIKHDLQTFESIK